MALSASDAIYEEKRLGGQDPNTVYPGVAHGVRTGHILRDLDSGAKYQFGTPVAGGPPRWLTFDGGQVVATDFLMYLNADTGLDTNDGQTPATAIQTITELIRRLPIFWRSSFNVYFAAGTYPPPEGGLILLPGKSGPLINTAPLGIWTGERVTVLADGVATGGDPDGAFVEFDDAGHPAPEFWGAILTMTSGAAEGAECRVNHTDGRLTFLTPLGAATDAGDTFILQRPGVVIDGTDNEVSFQSYAGDVGEHLFNDITFRGNLQVSSATLVLGAVDFDTLGRAIFFRERTRVDVEWPGFYVYGQGEEDGDPIGGSLNTIHFSQFYGIGMSAHTALLANNRSDVELYILDMYDTIALGSDVSSLLVAGFGQGNSRIYGLTADSFFMTEGGPVQPSGAITLEGGSRAEVYFMDATDNVVPTVVLATDDSRATVISVVGTGNSGFGLEVTNGASVFFDEGTEVTGTSGDIDQDGTTHAYADVLGEPLQAFTDARGNTVAALPA